MQPGGKRDPGEDDVTALAREIDEELGCRVVPGSVARSANSIARPRTSRTGRCTPRSTRSMSTGAVAPRAEIEEVDLDRSVGAAGDIPLAPLTRDHVLPLARSA